MNQLRRGFPGEPLVNALSAMIDPERFFARCLRQQGDPFFIRLPGIGELMMTGHPEGAREFFAARYTAFEPIHSNPVEPLLGSHSLTLLKGERHRRERKLLLPPFHGDRLHAYGKIIQELTLVEMRKCRVGEPFVAQKFSQSITLQVILPVIFGIFEQRQREIVTRAITTLMARYSVLLMAVPPLRRSLWGVTGWERFVGARDVLRGLLMREIAERRRDGTQGREDILSLLIDARYEDGDSLSDEELHDELCTMLVAGHESCATGLSWALYFALRNPAIREALRRELAPLGSAASADELVSQPYLGALVNEALRLHPIVPVVWRRFVEPISILGVEVPPRTNVGIAVTLLHKHPAVWRDPDRFSPERFLERSYAPHEYAPFGGGVRRCIGAAFGVYEMKIILGTIFSRTSVRLHGNGTARPVLKNITMGPMPAIRVVLEA